MDQVIIGILFLKGKKKFNLLYILTINPRNISYHSLCIQVIGQYINCQNTSTLQFIPAVSLTGNLANTFMICGRLYSTDDYGSRNLRGNSWGYDIITKQEFHISKQSYPLTVRPLLYTLYTLILASKKFHTTIKFIR